MHFFLEKSSGMFKVAEKEKGCDVKQRSFHLWGDRAWEKQRSYPLKFENANSFERRGAVALGK